MIDDFLNEAKNYLIKKDILSKDKIYGITRKPNTDGYIIVLYNEYSQEYFKECYFSDIEKIGQGGFSTVYSAVWKNGPLRYYKDKNKWIRNSDKKVALKCLNNSQNINNEFLNEVKAYSVNNFDNSGKIIGVYGISQNPLTKDYIMILQYAEGRNFNYWMNKNSKYFDWFIKLKVLDNCWDLNPVNRPNIAEIEKTIISFYNSYRSQDDNEIKKQFQESEKYRSINKNGKPPIHPQAIYTSRLLNPFTEDLDNECLDCKI
ncbi:uncharacterized protein OCT59_008082 [Rhizophagus irregularis]|uniref:uncharacterized protein n=1 Tax=Rhizophagus irregularis TaxID=588596 RepID=UPI00332AF692|nr:hypothetical protein OCT59_008082 [Rhizophagus irregularis]